MIPIFDRAVKSVQDSAHERRIRNYISVQQTVLDTFTALYTLRKINGTPMTQPECQQQLMISGQAPLVTSFLQGRATGDIEPFVALVAANPEVRQRTKSIEALMVGEIDAFLAAKGIAPAPTILAS